MSGSNSTRSEIGRDLISLMPSNQRNSPQTLKFGIANLAATRDSPLPGTSGTALESLGNDTLQPIAMYRDDKYFRQRFAGSDNSSIRLQINSFDERGVHSQVDVACLISNSETSHSTIRWRSITNYSGSLKRRGGEAVYYHISPNDLAGLHRVADIMTSLVNFVPSSVNAPLLSLGRGISKAQIERSHDALRSLIATWQQNESNDYERFEILCYAHFTKFSFVDGLDEFIEQEEITSDLVAIVFKVLSDIASEDQEVSFETFLLHMAATQRASIRYAAVEALGYHLSDNARTVLSIRLSEESNRTVCALIAASLR